MSIQFEDLDRRIQEAVGCLQIVLSRVVLCVHPASCMEGTDSKVGCLMLAQYCPTGSQESKTSRQKELDGVKVIWYMADSCLCLVQFDQVWLPKATFCCISSGPLFSCHMQSGKALRLPVDAVLQGLHGEQLAKKIDWQ